MGQAFAKQCRRPLQMRSVRVHAEQDIGMSANGNSPTMQQEQQGSHSSLQQGAAQSTLTHAAAVNGDKSALAKLLNNNRDDINSGDQFGRTPLMLAVLADQLECAEILIKHGAKVNNNDNAGRTALHWAAYKGNLRLSKLLLAKGANRKIKDKEGQSALHLATRHDNTKCLMLLIKQLEPGEQDEQDNAKRTALHWSSSYGNEEAVKLLIKHNSNIGIPDMDGKTPLHWAASAGHDVSAVRSPQTPLHWAASAGHDVSAVNTVKLILDTEPSVITWQDYEGRTALHLAVAQGNETIAQQLINFQTNLVKCNVSVLDNMFRTPLHWAAVLGHTHIVDLLLDAGANVTSSDVNGATPLHYAAQNNHAETVAAFLSRDSITDEPDLEGRTALMWAAGKGADAVIIRMVDITQPDINATDKTGATALHAAAMCGHPSTIQVLLELDSNVNILDQSKHTPLFRAAEMGHTGVVKVLVQGGAHVDIVDQEGRSPLHWAALGGHACICSILVGESINPNIQDFTGRTPLQCASYGGFTNSISLLLEKGADPNSQDSEGMTALHWCCSSGYLDAVKLLLDHGAFPNHMEYTEEHLTPLDYTLLNEHHHVAQYMIEQGALSITGIRDIAAIRVQAYFRGYRVRKTFVERKKLLMKHEHLRKDAAKKKVEMTKKNETEESSRDNKIVNDVTQTGREDKKESKRGNNKGTDSVDTESGKDRRGQGADRELATDSNKQSKKLCWETKTQQTTKENEEKMAFKDEKDGLMSKVKVENHISSGNIRMSDLNDVDREQLRRDGLERGSHTTNHNQKSTPEMQDASVNDTRSSKRNEGTRRAGKGIRRNYIDKTGLGDKIDKQDDNVNVNSNNSNSNDRPFVKFGRMEKVDDSFTEEHVVDDSFTDEHVVDDSFTSSIIKDFMTAQESSTTWCLTRQQGRMEERRQVVERLAVWRRKSDSAAIIQRAWRNFKQRQHKLKSGTIDQGTSCFHRPCSNPDHRAHYRTDPRAENDTTRCKHVAACTIQQPWRCYHGDKLSALLGGNKKYEYSLKTRLNALRQTVLMNKIYGKKQIATKPYPGAPSVHRARPHNQQYIPSAAALSFNFALDQYRPTVRNVKTPSSLQQLTYRSKHSSASQSRRSPSHTDGDVNRTGSRKSSTSARRFSYNHYRDRKLLHQAESSND